MKAAQVNMHTFLVILDTNDSRQALSAKELAQQALAAFDADTGPVCGPDGQPVAQDGIPWHTITLPGRAPLRGADGHNIARVAFFGMSAWALIAAGLIAYLY